MRKPATGTPSTRRGVTLTTLGVPDKPSNELPGLIRSPILAHMYHAPRLGLRSRTVSWESVPSGPVMPSDLRDGVSASDRERPLVTGVNGPLMARRSRFICTDCHIFSSIAAVSRAVAAVSRFAKRPRSGSTLTRRTRPRSLSSEEDGMRKWKIDWRMMLA
jgi:hypothetical protein